MEICGRDGRSSRRGSNKRMECKGRRKWRDAPLTKKAPYKPDALIGHVRFDERGWETERCRMAQATAPILDSTKADIGSAYVDVGYSGKSGHACSITPHARTRTASRSQALTKVRIDSINLHSIRGKVFQS